MYDDNNRSPRHYRKHAAVTAHDTNEQNPRPRSLLITAAGNLTIRLVDSTADLTLSAVAANTILPFRTKLIKSTGLTATVVALF